jgi:predicted amidohydrolase
VEYLDSYVVACIQNTCKVVVSNDPDEQDKVIGENVARLKELIEWTHYQSDGRAKLMVTGEYALTGTYRPRSIEEWMRLALPIPNRFTDELGETAKRFGCYIATQFMERDDNFPGLFFDTAVIIDPEGKVALKYRKHNGPNNLNVQYLAPGDVYDKYVATYGEDSLFPVLDTPLGKLGCFICYDINFPEVARCLALKGAEVLIHLTASTITLSQHWEELKVARAWENAAYLVSADVGPWTESRWPLEFSQGSSTIVSYTGDVIGCTNGPGERVVTAEINLAPLRKRRASLVPHQINPFFQLRASLYAKEYARAQAWPLNSFNQEPMRDRAEATEIAENLVAGWIERGQLKQP